LKQVFPTLAALRKTAMDKKEFDEQQLRRQIRLRSYYDFGMGILWIVAGVFFLGYRKLGMDFDFDPLVTAIFGSACILYGVFRIWRGYKSNQQAG
jgi:hypothetical protein